VRRNSGAVRNRRQATATSPPLGGVSVCFRGRSSDSAGSTLLAGLPSALRHQCHLGLSYLLTAAGQFRILTGFPLDAPCGATMEETTISCVSDHCKSIRCGYSAEGKSSNSCNCGACLGERDSASYAPSPGRTIGRLCKWLLLFRSVDLQLCSHRTWFFMTLAGAVPDRWRGRDARGSRWR
jgi:hypothetical protein